jgi:hypothetical protein
MGNLLDSLPYKGAMSVPEKMQQWRVRVRLLGWLGVEKRALSGEITGG